MFIIIKSHGCFYFYYFQATTQLKTGLAINLGSDKIGVCLSLGGCFVWKCKKYSDIDMYCVIFPSWTNAKQFHIIMKHWL